MERMGVWSIILLIAISAVYLLSEVLVPFFTAFIFAYILQPLINTNCKRFNIDKKIVSPIVFILFFSGFIGITLIIIPMIYEQLTLLISKIPQYKQTFETIVLNWSDHINKMDPEFAQKFSESMQGMINSIFGVFSSLMNSLWRYTIATINFVTIIILVPIILFYFLRDWDKMTSSIEEILPLRSKSKIREIFNSINELLSAFIRGQLNICLMLSIYYVIGMHLIGLDIALLLGFLAGFLIIIPFIGILIAFILSIISCYFSFGMSIESVYVILLFAFGYLAEGYVLSPKIIGNKIGLHPMWIVFSVFAVGHLLGFWGIVFAIPIAGIVKVLFQHSISYYKSSKIYRN